MAAQKKGESLAEKINRGVEATKKAVKNYSDILMAKKPTWLEVTDAKVAAEAELTKEWTALFTAVQMCEGNLAELRKAQERGQYKEVDACWTYRLVEHASMVQRLLGKVEVLQKQIDTYNGILNPE